MGGGDSKVVAQVVGLHAVKQWYRLGYIVIVVFLEYNYLIQY